MNLRNTSLVSNFLHSKGATYYWGTVETSTALRDYIACKNLIFVDLFMERTDVEQLMNIVEELVNAET